VAGEDVEGGGGGDLELRDRPPGIDLLDLDQRIGQFVLVDEMAAAGIAKADALVEADEMGRGIDVTRLPAASSTARMNAVVEPLPLVPAIWMTGASRRSGWPRSAISRSTRSSDRSISFG